MAQSGLSELSLPALTLLLESSRLVHFQLPSHVKEEVTPLGTTTCTSLPVDSPGTTALQQQSAQKRNHGGSALFLSSTFNMFPCGVVLVVTTRA